MSTTGYIGWVCKFCSSVNQGYLVECEDCGESRYEYKPEEDYTRVEKEEE
jgi:hypothetical protein